MRKQKNVRKLNKFLKKFTILFIQALLKRFLIDKQSQVDIMATLRSDFCITRGEGLFAHTKYCDLYIHCTAQAVAITMECSRIIKI